MSDTSTCRGCGPGCSSVGRCSSADALRPIVRRSTTQASAAPEVLTGADSSARPACRTARRDFDMAKSLEFLPSVRVRAPAVGGRPAGTGAGCYPPHLREQQGKPISGGGRSGEAARPPLLSSRLGAEGRATADPVGSVLRAGGSTATTSAPGGTSSASTRPPPPRDALGRRPSLSAPICCRAPSAPCPGRAPQGTSPTCAGEDRPARGGRACSPRHRASLGPLSRVTSCSAGDVRPRRSPLQNSAAGRPIPVALPPALPSSRLAHRLRQPLRRRVRQQGARPPFRLRTAKGDRLDDGSSRPARTSHLSPEPDRCPAHRRRFGGRRDRRTPASPSAYSVCRCPRLQRIPARRHTPGCAAPGSSPHAHRRRRLPQKGTRAARNPLDGGVIGQTPRRRRPGTWPRTIMRRDGHVGDDGARWRPG